jgi:hypothetical protein
MTNRNDILSNLTDFASSREGNTSEMQGNKLVKEELKIHHDVDSTQARHSVKHNVGVSK